MATAVARRLDTLLHLGDDHDAVVVSLEDPAVRDVIRCRSLAYASRYLRSVLADEAADLLDDRIIELGGEVDLDQTQIILIDK